MAHVRIEVSSRYVDRERPYKFAHYDRSVTSNEVIVVSVRSVGHFLLLTHLCMKAHRDIVRQPQHSVSRTH
eukprot:scaffold24447_cov150-Skeletonema_dohrnii-CCMP3373.AAC.1